MFRLKNETILFGTQIFLRNFSKTSKNLYDVLEITPKATQVIKTILNELNLQKNLLPGRSQSFILQSLKTISSRRQQGQ